MRLKTTDTYANISAFPLSSDAINQRPYENGDSVPISWRARKKFDIKFCSSNVAAERDCFPTRRIAMTRVGPHKQVGTVNQRDINGRVMVGCRECGTYAHAPTEEEATQDLSRTSCSPACENCKSLRYSYDGKPAVPIRGSCNDILHTCPNDSNRWWQTNTHFHLWQQVTSEREWESLNRPRQEYSEESGFGIGF